MSPLSGPVPECPDFKQVAAALSGRVPGAAVPRRCPEEVTGEKPLRERWFPLRPGDAVRCPAGTVDASSILPNKRGCHGRHEWPWNYDGNRQRAGTESCRRPAGTRTHDEHARPQRFHRFHPPRIRTRSHRRRSAHRLAAGPGPMLSACRATDRGFPAGRRPNLCHRGCLPPQGRAAFGGNSEGGPGDLPPARPELRPGNRWMPRFPKDAHDLPRPGGGRASDRELAPTRGLNRPGAPAFFPGGPWLALRPSA